MGALSKHVGIRRTKGAAPFVLPRNAAELKAQGWPDPATLVDKELILFGAAATPNNFKGKLSGYEWQAIPAPPDADAPWWKQQAKSGPYPTYAAQLDGLGDFARLACTDATKLRAGTSPWFVSCVLRFARPGVIGPGGRSQVWGNFGTGGGNRIWWYYNAGQFYLETDFGWFAMGALGGIFSDALPHVVTFDFAPAVAVDVYVDGLATFNFPVAWPAAAPGFNSGFPWSFGSNDLAEWSPACQYTWSYIGIGANCGRTGHDALVAALAAVPAQPTGGYAAADAMVQARARHATVEFLSGPLVGKVLATPGITTGVIYSAECELYDLAGDAWTVTGSSTAPNYYAERIHLFTSGVLSGKVLSVGGVTAAGARSAHCELYDPTTETWTATGAMGDARRYHAIALLPSGKLLVSGGLNAAGATTDTCEIYDPATETWAATGSMSVAREAHTLTVLPSGKVLAVAGWQRVGPTVHSSCEIFDETAGGGVGAWVATGSLVDTRQLHGPGPTRDAGSKYHAAVALASGKVLAVGGDDVNDYTVDHVQTFDESTGVWTAAPGRLLTSRRMHTATRLPSGKVLLAGGDYNAGGVSGAVLDSCEIYDPVSGCIYAAAALATARRWHDALLLSTGKVLVTGGNPLNPGDDITATDTCELYTP